MASFQNHYGKSSARCDKVFPKAHAIAFYRAVLTHKVAEIAFEEIMLPRLCKMLNAGRFFYINAY